MNVRLSLTASLLLLFTASVWPAFPEGGSGKPEAGKSRQLKHNKVWKKMMQEKLTYQPIEHLPASVNPNITASFRRGVEAQLKGHFNEALEQYKLVIAAGRDLFEPHFNMGLCLAQEKKLPQAQEAFQQAARINPRYRPIFQHLADVYRKQNMTTEAMEAYGRYLEL